MNELEIFSAALELADPKARLRYLEETCRGNAALRDRIEALLRNAGAASQFLETPAMQLPGSTGTVCETAAGNPPSTPQRGLDRTEISADASSLVLDFLGPSDDPKALGRIGQYTVTNVIGRGGMGIVLKAHDTSLNRVVAIKVLAPELSGNPMASKRFLREARAAAAVVHQHIVTIHAVYDGAGESLSKPAPHRSPLPYLVMEYVDGQSLQAKIDAVGALGLNETLRIGAQVAAGLAAAHAHGVVHRDIKPSNILLENGIERVRITDFGLARAVDDVEITRTGEVSGTPQYMSPEQAHGQPVDARSDLFSFGSVLYAMCTGRPPFRAETTIAAIRRVCDDAPRPISEINPEIPDWLTTIVDRLLAKRPEDRFQTAQEVAERLGQCLAHVQQPGSAPRPETLPSPPRREKPGMKEKTSLRWATAAMLLLAALAGLGVTEATGVTRLAGTIIRIATGEGTLIIETDDPTVQISLDGEELTISGGGVKEVRLRPGQYQFVATKNGKPVKQELVRITRGHERVVTVSREAMDRTTAAPPTTVDAGAFVVLGGEKALERKFNTLSDAVLGANDGDTIEVRGNGPFDTRPIGIAGHALTIRAGQGFRPVIRLTQAALDDRASLFVTDAPLVLEGLDLRLVGQGNYQRSARLPSAVHSNGAQLQIANCTLLRQGNSNSTLLFLRGTRRCELRNCLLLATAGSLLNWKLHADEGVLVMENCLRAGNTSINLFGIESQRDISLQFRRTTTVGPWQNLYVSLNGPPSAQSIRAEIIDSVVETGTLFTLNQSPSFYRESQPLPTVEAQALASRLLDWRGERNLYSLDSGYLGLSVEGGFESRPVATPIKTLQDWERFLNSEDADSLEGKPRFQGGLLSERTRTAVEQLTPEDFRLRADSAGYRAGPDGKDLGANVDLVGPGKAYERWKKTPAYQEWLKETGQLKDRAETKPKAQPFVRLGSEGLPDRKFDTLAEAVVDANDRDTIEIRDNGPFDTDPISIGGHALTIRAGQAYRPVIRLAQEGLNAGASIFVTDAPLVLEGLELRLAGQSQQERSEFGPNAVVSHGAPLHIANCTLRNTQDRPYTGLLLLQESRHCELRNCLFLARNGSLLNWPMPADQGEIVMDNCVCGGNMTINLYTRNNPRNISLQVTRTTTVMNQRFFYVDANRPLEFFARSIRVEASENMFETGPLFMLNQSPSFYGTSQPLASEEAQALASRLLDWRGERNLYSVRRGYLALSAGNHGNESIPLVTPIETLKDWNRFVSTGETDSQEGQARYQGGALLARIRTAVEQLTPDDFRLRPDSAGYRAGRDGKDLGADVDLVGPGKAYERWKATAEYQQWLKETAQGK